MEEATPHPTQAAVEDRQIAKAKYELSDAILEHLGHFAVGLVERVAGEGSRVAGSGVLVDIDGRRGILSCGHVAERHAEWEQLGLIRFAAGDQKSMVVKLAETFTIIGFTDEKCWTKDGADLAFTMLPPEIASSLAAKALFLNLEKNRERVEAGAPPYTRSFDSILGLVEEKSGKPFVEGGRFISPMEGVLHSGHLVSQERGLLVIDALEYNIPNLPESFGGMSGGGLWRTYYEEGPEGPKVVRTDLIGVASYQINERRIACQGWDRIDQALIPAIRDKLR